jgi:cyclic beta-1,2-glucan synthetase
MANKDPNLYWALLTDFADSKTEVAPNDGELLQAISQGIRELNERIPNTDGSA